MKCSYRISNGRVIDPASNTDAVKDIYISNSRIVEVPSGQQPEVKETIDASGCLVLPGLVDFHTHVNRGHSDLGIHPDLMALPNGVTATVDAGTTGSATFEGFYKDVICAAEITIKSFIHAAPIGVTTRRYPENHDPAAYDLETLEYLFERYREQILGLKVRISKDVSGSLGLRPLLETKKMARHLGTAMCAHVVNPENSYDEILSHFDRGDILCHCFQDKGPYNILDGKGKVGAAARQARERGVIFDAASGRANYSFAVARQAIQDGFPPDIISTDGTNASIYKPILFSLLWVMSAYMALGMSLHEVLRAATQTPARLMGLEGKIGTLAPGALADVAIIKIRQQPMVFEGLFDNKLNGDQLLIPMATFKAGRCAYMRMDLIC